MKIEVLFPELCNLYGDNGNIQYLGRLYAGGGACAHREPGDAPVYKGAGGPHLSGLHVGVPSGAGHPRLLPHAGVLRQYVESGGVLLATGNALELFGTYIQVGSGRFRRWACSPATPSGIWSTGTIPCFWVPLGT